MRHNLELLLLCLLWAIALDIGISWTFGFWPFNDSDEDDDDHTPPDLREKYA